MSLISYYPTQFAVTNSRLILIYLITASLPIGLLPNPQLLQEFSLKRIFGPVIQSMRQGNFELLSYALYGESREWFRAMGIWLILVERLETLLWRVFLRKMYFLIFMITLFSSIQFILPARYCAFAYRPFVVYFLPLYLLSLHHISHPIMYFAPHNFPAKKAH